MVYRRYTKGSMNRVFVSEMRGALNGSLDDSADSSLRDWLSWAFDAANRMDPISSTASRHENPKSGPVPETRLSQSARPASKGPDAQPLLLREKDLPRLLSLSRAMVRREMAAGRFPPAIRLGRCVLWRRADLEKWIANGCRPIERP